MADQDVAKAASPRTEALTCADEAEEGDALVGVHVDLVDDASGLGKALAVALDGVLVALQTRVDHPAIVVVRDDLDRTGA